MRNERIGMKVKRDLYERIPIPTVMNGSELWSIRCTKGREKCFEMKCLRSMVSITRKDKVRNEIILRRTGLKREIACIIYKTVRRWVGHMETIQIG